MPHVGDVPSRGDGSPVEGYAANGALGRPVPFKVLPQAGFLVRIEAPFHGSSALAPSGPWECPGDFPRFQGRRPTQVSSSKRASLGGANLSPRLPFTPRAGRCPEDRRVSE